MSGGACEICPANKNATLKRMGLDLSKFDFVAALAGNPNTGKSTVFNALTGLRQHTGNWPGKTVARAEGAFEYSGSKYKIVDLPGTYSLLSTSTDEEITLRRTGRRRYEWRKLRYPNLQKSLDVTVRI